jgi:hypothetical protein
MPRGRISGTMMRAASIVKTGAWAGLGELEAHSKSRMVRDVSERSLEEVTMLGVQTSW